MTITPPKRGPDYISKFGGHYWFKEMVFIDQRSEWHEIDLDRHNMLIRKDRVTNCKKCDHCIEDGICEHNYFAAHVQEAYDKWLTQEFESTFFGEQ